MSRRELNQEDANWWTFSLLPSGDPMPEAVNPELEDKRHTVTYSEILQLDKILSAQRPSSTAPDERAFIIAHQLFELCFKLMIFDLVVLQRTIAESMALKSDELLNACTEIDHPLWIPGRSAAARLSYTSNLMGRFFEIIKGEGFAKPGPDEDFTFRADEFHGRFRSNLPPASGFQSEQFRVIQLALSKGPIFSLQYFDASMYFENYRNEKDRHDPVAVTHPIIFRDKPLVPLDGERENLPTLDEQVYRLLNRLGEIWELTPEQVPMPDHTKTLNEIKTAFRTMVSAFYQDREQAREERVAAFMQQLDAVCLAEWGGSSDTPGRLQKFGLARAACRRLREAHPHGGFTKCIAFLDLADRRFSAFLPNHFKTAKSARLEDDDAGSAGGGIRFLSLSESLLKLFPMFRALDMKKPPEKEPAAW